MTEKGVSVSEIAETGGAAIAAGYTPLAGSETGVEIAAAEQVRESRAARLARQPHSESAAEPEVEPTSRTCADADKEADGPGCAPGGANKSSIGFEMDDKMAEALGFRPAGTSKSS